jgi:hypothetical protein
MVAQADCRRMNVVRVTVIIFITPGAGKGACIRTPTVIVDIGGRRWNVLLADITGILLLALDALLPLAFTGLW